MTTPTDIIIALRKQLRQANDRIEELEGQAGVTLFKPLQKIYLHLTKQQTRLVGLLLIRGVDNIITRDAIHLYLYGGRQECDQPELSTVNTLVAHTRRVVKPHGVMIDNEYGMGWYLTKENAERLTTITAHLRAA